MLQVIARDKQGNRMTRGGNSMKVVLSRGSKRVQARVVDNQDGSYTAAFQCNEAGVYSMTISMEELPIFGSPFHVSVAEGAGFVRLRAFNATCVAGEHLNLWLDCMDRHNNNVRLGMRDVTAAVYVDAQCTTLASTALTLQQSAGVLVARLLPRKVGQHYVAISHNSQPIDGRSLLADSLLLGPLLHSLRPATL